MYKVTEDLWWWEIYTWYFNSLKKAEKFLNENVKDIDWKWLQLWFDNWTWSLHKVTHNK